MNRYIQILEKFSKLFNEEYIAAILRKKEEEPDLPMDILTVVFEELSEKGKDWIGEFCFLPLANGAEDTAYLSAAITLDTEMDPYASDNVAWFIVRMNHYIPYGAFSISEDRETVAYKLCTPVLDTGDDEALYQSMSLIMSHALDIVENFGILVEAVLEGDITPDEALNQFLGKEE